MTQDQHLDKLAFRFFKEFSRTEYALKVNPYYKIVRGFVEADWTKFSRKPEVKKLFVNPTTLELDEAIKFILADPPKKQVIIGGKLDWEISEPNTNSPSEKLLLYIRRIRNNLFHGGKFNNYWFAPQRSEPLLCHSLVILSAVREAVPKVKEAYESKP